MAYPPTFLWIDKRVELSGGEATGIATLAFNPSTIETVGQRSRGSTAFVFKSRAEIHSSQKNVRACSSEQSTNSNIIGRKLR